MTRPEEDDLAAECGACVGWNGVECCGAFSGDRPEDDPNEGAEFMEASRKFNEEYAARQRAAREQEDEP